MAQEIDNFRDRSPAWHSGPEWQSADALVNLP